MHRAKCEVFEVRNIRPWCLIELFAAWSEEELELPFCVEAHLYQNKQTNRKTGQEVFLAVVWGRSMSIGKTQEDREAI